MSRSTGWISSLLLIAALAVASGQRAVSADDRERLEIVDRVPIEIPPNGANIKYLKTKKEKLGHILDMV